MTITDLTETEIVNPACAGMILYITPQHRGVTRKPRVCGDDPARGEVRGQDYE